MTKVKHATHVMMFCFCSNICQLQCLSNFVQLADLRCLFAADVGLQVGRPSSCSARAAGQPCRPQAQGMPTKLFQILLAARRKCRPTRGCANCTQHLHEAKHFGPQSCKSNSNLQHPVLLHAMQGLCNHYARIMQIM